MVAATAVVVVVMEVAVEAVAADMVSWDYYDTGWDYIYTGWDHYDVGL